MPPGSTLWRCAPSFLRRPGRVGRPTCHRAPSWSACPPSIGARHGSMASALFATASTMWAMPWQPSALQPRGWAGRLRFWTTWEASRLPSFWVLTIRWKPRQSIPTACWPSTPRATSTRAPHCPRILWIVFRQLALAGQANQLSPARRSWPLIDEVAAATTKPATSAVYSQEQAVRGILGYRRRGGRGWPSLAPDHPPA